MEVKFLNLPALYLEREEAFLTAIKEVLNRGAYIGGKELERFEAAFGEWVGQENHVLGCANGTDALYLAARSLDLPPDSEAIVPAMTYVATVEALKHAGLRVRLVDIAPDTYLMERSSLEGAISKNTRLIVPVHLYGQMVSMDEISELAKSNDCRILEDAAQAHGATWKNHPVGYWGDIAAYSFYPGKNLGAFGDAGAVLSRDEKLIRLCRALGNHGGTKKYEHKHIGVNSRLDNLQAAILEIKLESLDKWNANRRRLAGWYQEGLGDLDGISLPTAKADAQHVYHLYVVQVEERESFQAHLQQHGIQSGIHYPEAIHQLPAFAKEFDGQRFPNAEKLAACGVSLPMCPTINEKQAAWVVEKIRSYFGK